MRFEYHTALKLPVVSSELTVHLAVPENAIGIVIFSFGGGVHHLAEYQQNEIAALHKNHFGTLIFDPLSPGENENFANRFNINLLAERLLVATKWLSAHKSCARKSIGYFAAGAGAAAALTAAAHTTSVGAIVCRDGKLIPSTDVIPAIKAPTLLLAGEMDELSNDVQASVFAQLSCIKKLQIIKGAGRHYAIPSQHEEMLSAAIRWFAQHLA